MAFGQREYRRGLFQSIKKAAARTVVRERLLYGERFRLLFEVFRSAFRAFAFVAFGYIFELSAFKQSFHNNFATAGTEKFMCCNRCT